MYQSVFLDAYVDKCAEVGDVSYEGMSELQPIEGQPDAEAATDEEQYDVAVMEPG